MVAHVFPHSLHAGLKVELAPSGDVSRVLGGIPDNSCALPRLPTVSTLGSPPSLSWGLRLRSSPHSRQAL